jgi:hypothetical protein
MSLTDAMTKANSEQSPAYWEQTRAKAAEAKAQKEAPATPAPTAQEPDNTPAEIREIDQRVGVLRQQFAGLVGEEEKYTKSLAMIEDAAERITRTILTSDLDFEQEQKAKAELKSLTEQRDAHKRYLGHIASRKEALEDKYAIETRLKTTQERLIAIQSAREAEIKEREARATEAKREAEEARWRAASVAWETNFDAIKNEGDPVPNELLEKFKRQALDHIFAATKGAPAAPGDIPKLLREAKAEFDRDWDLAHRLKSRAFNERKEKDLQIGQPAPDSKSATAPVVKKRAFASDDEFEAHINRSFAAIQGKAS